jgi:DNA methylase
MGAVSGPSPAPSVLIEGDCMDALAGAGDESFDAIVTDPPYGLGFMGRAWDALPPGVPWARECLRVLRPGGHLLAFGGTRTYHRLACAIEDAGFEIRDTVVWLYGSGFPKSHNLTDDWQGWGTALKPAHEPIVLARKPLAGTVAVNVLEHGTGALNVDGCRIGFSGEGDKDTVQGATWYAAPNRVYGKFAKQHNHKGADSTPDSGRWPANVVLDDDAATMLDAQAGLRGGGYGISGRTDGSLYEGGWQGTGEIVGYGDAGGASRFFYVAKASTAERNVGLDGFEVRERRTMDGGAFVKGKDRRDARGSVCRNIHPTVKPVELMRWLVRLITPPGGAILDPFAGTGTTGIAAHLEGMHFVGIEREADYVEIARARLDFWRRVPAGMNMDAVLASERMRAAMEATGQLELLP